MKTKAIPFFAALSCSLTACTNEKEETEENNVDTEDTDTEDTDTDDTDTDTDDTGEEEEDIGDLSNVLGLWTVDAQGFYGYNISFPQEDSYSLEAYDVEWIQGYARSIFNDIAEDGSIEEIVFTTETETLIINGVEIYYASIGATQLNEGSGYGYGYYGGYGMTIRESGGDYIITTFGIELSCTLTGDSLSCADEGGLFSVDMTKNTEGVPDDFTDIRENFPETPEYTKDDCVDATITTTGNSIEMGGFEDVDGDVAFQCEISDAYGYSSSPAPNHEDLVFAFTAPNDGCFAFDTTGTNFEHGIQLMEACGETALDCSMEGNLLREMSAGEEILVVIDGRERNDQVFNLHINEQTFDTSDYEEFPADTSSMNNSSGWTEVVNTETCGAIENGKTWLWTAPSTGTASFDLAGSDFLVIMEVAEATCSGGDKYCNGETGFGGNSVLEVPVEQGMSYLVSVGGLWGLTGNISLAVTVE